MTERHASRFRLAFSRLTPSRPGLRKVLRGLGWSLFVFYLLFTALVLTLRYGILPEIHRYQNEIEAAAGKALGLPVSIGHLQARWTGLNPVLVLSDVRIANKEGNPALTLERVTGILSWRSLASLWRGEPRFLLLELERPSLQIRRDAQGEIFVAGLSTAGSGDGGSGLRWLLAQSRIRILDATLAWEDELRQAPPLVLEDVQFELQNQGHRHRFGLFAQPPSAFASRLDVRGDLRGRAKDATSDWQGTVYAALDYADLSIWKSWVDYPAELPQGRGGIRLWAEQKDGVWSGVADLALRDLRLRVKRELPELDLQTLDGRLQLTQSPGYLKVVTRQLRLKTRDDGPQLMPLDLTAEWWGDAGEAGHGTLEANRLDLQSLARLAAHLPLGDTSRKLLEQHQPQGEVQALSLSWDGRNEEQKKYSLKAAFSGLGIKAHGLIPGAKGLEGRVEANETGGHLSLDAKESQLSLPAVFAEPDTPFTRLQAQINWQPEMTEGVTLHIERLDFSSPYADGQLSGTYRSVPGARGIADLQGSLSRGQGTEVWRYMPKILPAKIPAWLEQGLRSGTARDVRLILKGDLKNFPFRDPKQGQFLITLKAENAILHYGEHWPVIEELEGELSFGVGMKIDVHKGRILGARLEKATVEIPDFANKDPLLQIHGHVAGETAEFLDFIEQSPVGERIHHFTREMAAQGQGRLELSLELPLKDISRTRVAGNYTFMSNQVAFAPDLPPINNTQGRLDFTGNSLEIGDLSGNFLGQPMHLSAHSDKDAVNVKASGGLTAQALRHHFGWPGLEALSGSTDWQIEMKLRQDSEFLFTSTLQGLSSSLPSPLGKSAGESLPLRLQKSTLKNRNAPLREMVTIHLGKLLEAQAQRRKEGRDFVLERGMIGIGQVGRMPDNGVNLFVAQETLNLDEWQSFLQGRRQENTENASAVFAFPLKYAALNVQELTFFGRSFTEAGIRLTPDEKNPAGRFRIQVASREAVGELTWDDGNDAKESRITANLKRLHLSANGHDDKTGELALRASSPAPKNLPGMDIAVEDFSVGDIRLGRLELKADNAGGYWNLRQITLDNPDGRLSGSGRWETASGDHRTFLDFNLEVTDSGKLLQRLGYPGIVRGGVAQLNGKLDWAGAPSSLDTATLNGSLRLNAAGGQFSKVEPGVGKLLGLLSLQSITRRLSLDFRDIFSNGFAYDRITAQINLRHGVLETVGDLKIDSPSGEVLMQGTADMKTETQDLDVTVQPEIGGIAAVGAAIAINPVVGAATLLAQNLLKNPLNKAFSLKYKVTGTWADPKVEKIGMTGIAPALPGATPGVVPTPVPEAALEAAPKIAPETSQKAMPEGLPMEETP